MARRAQGAATNSRRAGARAPAAEAGLLTRHWSGVLALIGACAVVLRVANILWLQHSAVLSILTGDAHRYDAWAQQIAGGAWMGTDVFYQSPLYPYLIAVIYKIAGHHVLVVRLLQAGLGGLSCVLLGMAGRRFFSPLAGLLAAALLACYPPAIFFDAIVQKASLDLLLVTLTIAILGEILHRREGRRVDGLWISAGVAAGLFALNRENARVLYPVVVAWTLLYFRPVPIVRRLTWAAWFTAGIALVFLPVGWRNYHVGGEFLISTSQAGTNFYIGNHAGASGGYDPLLPDRGDADYERADATRLATEAAGHPLSPNDVSNYWWGRAFDDIRRDPGAWVGLLGRKLLLTINGHESSDTESIEAHTELSPVLWALGWFHFGMALPLAALGVWTSRRDWRRLALLYAIFVVTVASVAIFFVFARYRYSLVPIVLLFAAAAIDAFARRRALPQERWLPGLVGAAGIAIIANVPIKTATDATWFSVGAALLDAHRPADAVAPLERAVQVSPGHPPAHFDLGLALRQTGQIDRAIEEFTEAIQLRPAYPDALGALSDALLAAGQPADALTRAQQLVQLDPSLPAGHTNLAKALRMNGHIDQAIDEYAAAMRLKPADPVLHNNLATALQIAGRVREAIPEYEQALALDPRYADAHGNLAMAYDAIGRADEATAHFQEALRLDARNFGLRLNFGDVLLRRGDTNGAIAQFESAAALVPVAAEAQLAQLDRLARAYAKAGRIADAIGTFERARTVAADAHLADRVAEFTAAIAGLRKGQ